MNFCKMTKFVNISMSVLVSHQKLFSARPGKFVYDDTTLMVENVAGTKSHGY